jgi:hypothetical protein
MTITIKQVGLLPLFDAVYGSSAGALNAAWLLCGRAESTSHASSTTLSVPATRGPTHGVTQR